MKHKVFSVFDEKAMAYLPPFIMHREEMAMRVFFDCVNSKDHNFARHPADYTLFEIGEFCDTRGEMIPSKVARNLGNGVIFKRTDAAVDEIPLLEDGDNA